MWMGLGQPEIRLHSSLEGHLPGCRLVGDLHRKMRCLRARRVSWIGSTAILARYADTLPPPESLPASKILEVQCRQAVRRHSSRRESARVCAPRPGEDFYGIVLSSVYVDLPGGCPTVSVRVAVSNASVVVATYITAGTPAPESPTVTRQQLSFIWHKTTTKTVAQHCRIGPTRD